MRQFETREENLSNKSQNSIPYDEARKMIAGSKTPTYSKGVQKGKVPHKKYEEIMKTLIYLEPDGWESFINEINASLELEKNYTVIASETISTLRDGGANKGKPSTQIQASMRRKWPYHLRPD